ncbi:MAG: putative DNA-binding protein [Firmicutes bacterium]|nr:putative DNA-binding protein [Bacillota bacterium]
MEKVSRMALLQDFYGQLLTDKQRQVMELYYDHDLSLGEIAEEYGTSRQAVYDLIRRAEKTLEEYEAKLGLIAKFMTDRQQLSRVAELLEEFQVNHEFTKIEEIQRIVKDILAS